MNRADAKTAGRVRCNPWRKVGFTFLHPDILNDRCLVIRKGFVYKRVPHITLKAIANNEEIDAIHAKWQETLEPL
jgi:hypothetical protein